MHHSNEFEFNLKKKQFHFQSLPSKQKIIIWILDKKIYKTLKIRTNPTTKQIIYLNNTNFKVMTWILIFFKVFYLVKLIKYNKNNNKKNTKECQKKQKVGWKKTFGNLGYLHVGCCSRYILILIVVVIVF